MDLGGLVGIGACYWVDEVVLTFACTRCVAGVCVTLKGLAMRIVIDIMIGLMLVAVVAGGLYLYNSRQHRARQAEAVRGALQQLQEQAAYHTAVESAMAGRDVLLVHLHREWFGEHVPTNVLLEGDRPWIDLAPPGDLGEHPPDPVVSSELQAGFWYNPTTGTFRARVAPASSEALTLALYNDINGSALSGFDVIPDTSRQPLAHVLGQTPARQYAAMANKTWSEPVVEQGAPATDLITAKQPRSDTTSTADSTSQVNQVIAPILKKPAQSVVADEPALVAVDADLDVEARPTLQKLSSD